MSGCAVIGKWSTFGLSPITAQWCVLVFTYCRTDLVADLGLLFIVQWPLEFNNKEKRLRHRSMTTQCARRRTAPFISKLKEDSIAWLVARWLHLNDEAKIERITFCFWRQNFSNSFWTFVWLCTNVFSINSNPKVRT